MLLSVLVKLILVIFICAHVIYAHVEITGEIIEKRSLRNRYNLLKKLNQGAFGQIWTAFDTHTSTQVAIKKSKFDRVSINEVNLLRNLNTYPQKSKSNHHIIKLNDYFKQGDDSFIVYDLLPISLYDFIHGYDHGFNSVDSRFSPKQLQLISHQLLEAVAFLHDQKICHCDIKPGNIMLTNMEYETKSVLSKSRKEKVIELIHKPNIQLIDFGVSFNVSMNPTRTGIKGTVPYASPEMLLMKDYDVSTK
jgi:serine/threonine protein kinase